MSTATRPCLADFLLAQEVSVAAVEALISRMDEATPQYLRNIAGIALKIAASLPHLLANPRGNTVAGQYVSLASWLGVYSSPGRIDRAYATAFAGRFYEQVCWSYPGENLYRVAIAMLEHEYSPNTDAPSDAPNEQVLDADVLRRMILARMVEGGQLTRALVVIAPISDQMREHLDPDWPLMELIVLQHMHPGTRLTERAERARAAWAGDGGEHRLNPRHLAALQAYIGSFGS